MMKVAVLQSNYIPWKGYFDIINDVDLFIFHDDLQYTKNDWRNRNKIQTPMGPKWLTIPCGTNEKRLILNVKLNDKSWQRQHYAAIQQNYRKAPHFHEMKDWLEYVYLDRQWDYLYELNRYVISHIAHNLLGCSANFADSRDFKTHGAKQEKLLTMLQNAGATTYVSGPSAKDYIVVDDFEAAGIELVWKDYAGYPEYTQNNSEFTHAVSIIDLLLQTGDQAAYLTWGWRG